MRIGRVILYGILGTISMIAGCAAPKDGSTENSVAVVQQVSAMPPDSVMPPKHTIALATGISMAYLELGNPDGPPVIFLHGYTDTSRSFYPTVQALIERHPHLHLFVLDQRGHGASSMPPASACAGAPEQCFRPADLAADVIAFMDAKHIREASIVGHSMGSFVAQELGLSYPGRVERLILVSTGPSLVDNVVLRDYILAEPVEGSWKAGFEAQGYAFPQGVYNLNPLDANADALKWITDSWVFELEANPHFLASIVPDTAHIKMGTWLGVARALLATDNTERLKHLSVPTLILWATQDGVFYEADEKALRASLDVAVAGCKMEYYFKQYGKRPLSDTGSQTDDIGHNIQWGAPEQVASDIASYLQHGMRENTGSVLAL